MDTAQHITDFSPHHRLFPTTLEGYDDGPKPIWKYATSLCVEEELSTNWVHLTLLKNYVSSTACGALC